MSSFPSECCYLGVQINVSDLVPALNSIPMRKRSESDDIYFIFFPFSIPSSSGTRMDPDDSMYKGRPYNSRVSSAHNPTSIIQTRASKRAEAVVSRTTSSKRADAIAVDSENDGAPPLHPSPRYVSPSNCPLCFSYTLRGGRLRRPQRSRIQTESETEDALAPAEEAEHSPDPNKYDVTDPFM